MLKFKEKKKKEKKISPSYNNRFQANIPKTKDKTISK